MLKHIQHTFSYWLVRLIGYPLSKCSYKAINKTGKILGSIAYYLSSKHRKRCMTNLTIAKDLHLSEKEMKAIAKGSFQNLVTTTLEFFRLPNSYKCKFSDIIINDTPEILNDLQHQDKGIVFFSGHQANWEVPLFDVTQRNMKGVAIGRPIKNTRVYNWILSIREMTGGKIIKPQSALSKGLKELRKGNYLGIVGDQGFPSSSYSSLFLGTRAWTTLSPALLSYRTGCPLVVCTTYRKNDKLHIHYHSPIYPDRTKPLKEEAPKIMDKALSILEDSIKAHPSQWLWQHQRWKQHDKGYVHKQYRYDFLLVIIPDNEYIASNITPQLNALHDLYPRGFITYMTPEKYKNKLKNYSDDIIVYRNNDECLIRSWKYQMIIDFTGNINIKRHYVKLGAFKYLDFSKQNIIDNFTNYLNNTIRR